MKSISPILLTIVIAVAAISSPKANAQEAGASGANAAVQENNASLNLSGDWRVSWAGAKGGQRDVTMQIRQDGNKLSGTLQGNRGSAPLKGSLSGNQVSINVKTRKHKASFTGTVNGDKMSGTTEQGASWTATRQ